MKFDLLKEFSIPKMEEQILQFWEDNKIFDKTLEAAQDRLEFVFYEGPPTANGRPGVHHVISRTIKDLVCRYKSMKGFRVERKGGWDTHGLPVEIEVEKKLGLDSKAKVIEFGVDKFNQQCKDSVFEYLNEWNEITRRTGYWIDLDNAYVTLTNDYIESVWWILKNFFDRDLIYKGYKTVPYCPRCETALSSHEVAQGYEEVGDPSVFVKVKAADDDFSYLVWTTTPWTLPSNAALCMHPDADYALVVHNGEKLVLAESLLCDLLGSDAEVLEIKKGSEFEKRKYLPLFDTFKEQADEAFYLITADFVTLEDGTGIVHVAPGYGADDYEIGRKYSLPVLQAVRADGYFKSGSGKYEGKFIKDADPLIIDDLKKSGALYRKDVYIHNYPFCWRCDAPLIYISRQCWYIKTTAFKDKLIKNNNLTNWYPDEMRVGRMLDWLENNVDWALSRERFWGTPLPIWICDSCKNMTAVGSVEQLRKEGIGVPDELDLHKPMIDNIKLHCQKCKGNMTRIPEVIDTWFDTGSMPYAQWHYPFENKELFEVKYPAEFIAEGVDQTRGWFYSLLAISTMLFDKPAFNNVLVMEMILDIDGKKMSKHKGNVTDPFEIVNKYGADPLRWYLLHVSNPWLPIRFDEQSLAEVIRKFFDTFKNSYSFFALYANIDNIANRASEKSEPITAFLEKLAGEPERIDLWIESKFNSLIRDVTQRLDNYDLTPPTRMINDFVVNYLSNWYIRLNRRRFWAPGDDPSKMRAYLTLYRILCDTTGLIAPYCPFTAEFFWRELTVVSTNGRPVSVHMKQYPEYDESKIDLDLEESMDLAERIVSIGRAARSRKNLKVRQPLSEILVNIPGVNRYEKLTREITLIKDELNVKEIGELADIGSVVSYQAKLNFATAGKKLGARVKKAAEYIGKMKEDEIVKLQTEGSLSIKTEESAVSLSLEDVIIDKIEKEGYAVESGDGITVALKTEIDETLRDEGFAREVVNKIQNMRKSSGFEVTDRINILVETTDPLASAMKKHSTFICKETLADTLDLVSLLPPENGGKSWNINGVKANIAVNKI
jgi:isoleucyl-tRNA synthetase